MTTITIQEKNYDIKDTLLVKEYTKLMERLKWVVDIQEKIKTSTPEEFGAIANQVNSITAEDYEFVKSVVVRCFALTDEELGNMKNVDMLLLFDEVRKESSALKKK